MINDLLNDIILAKNNKAYFSALALALTIPDICGKIEYSKLQGRERYIKWFDEWIYSKYYKCPPSSNSMINTGSEATAFNGNACYALRCAFLHAGNTDIKGHHWTVDRFSLCMNEGDVQFGDVSICSVTETSASNIYVSINVCNLIDKIASGTLAYLKSHSDIDCPYGNITLESSFYFYEQ